MKYLSKLLSMFLVGAMLYSTGCTDYGEDIANLNDKVDNLEQELVNGQINPLKADLAATKAALEAAIETAKSEILTQHEADVKTLKEADAKAEEAIEAALKAIKDGDDALDKKIADAVTAIGEANKKIEALETVDTQIKENLTTLENSLKGTQADVESLKGDVDSMKGDVESLKQLAMQLTAWSANVDSAIATINTKIEDIEESIEDLEGNVETLKEFYQQQIEWNQNMDGRVGNLEEFKSFAEEQFEALADADKNLETLIANTAETLRGELKDYQDIVRTQFEQVYQDIAKNTTAINNLTADLQAKYDELVAADKALQDAIATHEEWITNAESRIANLEENMAEVKENLEKLQKDYDAFKEDVTTRLRNAEGSIGQLQVDVQGLNDKLNEFKAAYDEHIKAYEQFVEETNSAITDMKAIIDAIIGRVQSIAFVPEYVDGKGTINWATFGDRILEGRSVLVYQVYPAECAAAIANAPAVGDVVSPLSFDMTDVLKTRGGLDRAPQMNIVGVEGDAEGRLYVSVEARNFGEDFYAGEAEYAVSLVLTTEKENLASCYTNVVAGEPESVEMRIMATKDVTLTSVNEGAKFEDVTGNNKVYTKELTYTNIENNPDYVVLPGYYLEFEYNGKWYTEDAMLSECGIAVGDIKMEWSIIAENQMGLVINGQLNTVLNEATGYSEIVYDLQKVSASLIGKEYGIAYKYFYPGTDKSINAGSSILFTKEQAYVDFAPAFTATWNYLEDAAIDAAKLNISEDDSVDPMAVAHYTREFGYALADATVNNLPADTKLADVLNMEPAKVLVNGEEVENMEVVITAEGENATVEFLGFEWDKTYEIAVVYELSNVDVNVKFGFETFDRNRKPILVDLGNYTGVYATNLVFTDKVVDTMEGYIAQTVDAYPANFAGITAADYLLDVFVTHDYHVCDTDHLFTNTVNGVVAEHTKLVINEENGQTIAAIYDYNDAVASKDGVIVDALAYSKKMTLWYGQEVEFVKTVNFTAPEVYFQRVANYVEEAFDGYATYVQPYYFPNSDYATALEKFDVNKVDLNAAFDLQEADATSVITVPVSGNERGIAVSANGNVYRPEFRLTDVKDIYKDGKGILLYDNYISYYGKDEFVNVDANLYLRNDNGAEMKIATNFDAAVDGYEDYTNYVVWGYNPINMPTGEDMFEEVTDYGEYEVDLTEMFSMKDRRGHTGKITGWEMINKGRVYGDNFLVDGDGENGFAEGYNAGYIYGYYLRDEQGIAYGDIIPVDVKFLLKGNDAEQLKAKNLLEVDMNTGIVKFHYTSQVDLRKPITINVAVQITTAWNVSTHENVLVIRKKADTVEETPAE